ncbi:hypothetical protein KCP78_13125 [Salmonella enterica subsp. enterica]|nr:hypothetical protein KCP78_13125 [Salmonella enterica subsp. enterica]
MRSPVSSTPLDTFTDTDYCFGDTGGICVLGSAASSRLANLLLFIDHYFTRIKVTSAIYPRALYLWLLIFAMSLVTPETHCRASPFFITTITAAASFKKKINALELQRLQK